MIDGDNDDDLALSAPDEDYVGASNTGTIWVLKSNGSALVATGSQFFSQVPLSGAAESEDRFGMSLAAGQLAADC